MHQPWLKECDSRHPCKAGAPLSPTYAAMQDEYGRFFVANVALHATLLVWHLGVHIRSGIAEVGEHM